jgi:hypothetical protein
MMIASLHSTIPWYHPLVLFEHNSKTDFNTIT